MKGDIKEITANIKKVAIFFLGLLTVLFIYVSYIQIWKGNFLVNHPLNRRSFEAVRAVPAGSIFDRKGEKLAYSQWQEERFKRYYPYGKIMAHAVGYDSLKYGKAGIESSLSAYLSGLENPIRDLGPIGHLQGQAAGNDVILTLDAALQQTAYRTLGNRRGAVVAINPKSGEILAMVSTPSFDPNRIDEQWESISNSDESVLLNRVLQGLYPPGSILKIMIAEAALAEKVADAKKSFQCEGSLKVAPDYILRENKLVAHGKVNLSAALAESCNVTFGTIALELGSRRLSDTFKRYGFNQSFGGILPEADSLLPDFDRLGKGDLAQIGIGQGSLLVTPLRMAMLASCFANQGVIMKPYIVKRVLSPEGAVIKEFNSEKWLSPAKGDSAQLLSSMMVRVVNEGTGTGAYIPGVSIAGKTGTAENPHGEPHAWFIGFAPADDPQIALAVIVENGGAGGSVAAPIARELFIKALY